MANGWTPERRARQAQLIRQWQPWNRSTGPQSEEGKRASCRNALKHGLRSAEWEAQRSTLVDALREAHDCQREVHDAIGNYIAITV